MPLRRWTHLFLVASLTSPALCAAADTPDLQQAHLQFLATTDRPLDALAAYPPPDDGDYAAATAKLLASAGLTERAQALLQGLESPAADPVWLALAETYYALGEYEQSEHALLQIGRQPAGSLAKRKRSLLGRILMHRGDYDQAVLAMRSGQWLGNTLPSHDQYNLAIAWLRSRETTRGTGVLNELGKYSGNDPHRLAVADQANLALGYWFLRDARGGLARSAFQRVRLDGPLNATALLGMGWAELAPAGGVQRLHQQSGVCAEPEPDLWSNTPPLHAVPRPGCREPISPFEEDRLGGQDARTDKAATYRRAAVAWQQATQENPMQPAVQEALINLAFALESAGDKAEAVEQYRRAIRILENVDARLTADDQDAQVIDQLAQAGHAGDRSLQYWQHLQAQHQAMAKRLERRIQAVEQLMRNDRTDDLMRPLQSTLQSLREGAGADRGYAHPSPEQRGLLQTSLRAIETRQASLQRLQELRPRLASLKAQLEQLGQAVESGLQQHQAELIRERRESLRFYLKQARIGLARLQE